MLPAYRSRTLAQQLVAAIRTRRAFAWSGVLAAWLALAPAAPVSAAALSFAPTVSYGTGTQPIGVAVGDLNGDGLNDLVVAQSGANSVGVLLGTGAGSFGARVDYPTGKTPQYLAIADYNNDGKLDVAVSCFGYYSAGQSLSILLGNGNGTLAPRADYNTPPGPMGIVAGDFNADGKKDIALAKYGQDLVCVYLGNGSGAFATFNAFPSGAFSILVAAGDFNSDGRLDLVSGSGDGAGVFMGIGNGAFQARVDYKTPNLCWGLAVADLNADGRPDIVGGIYNGTALSVLLGNGNGTFQPRVDYPANSSCGGVAIADFNCDGKPDLAASYPFAAAISILPGVGNGTFSPNVDFFLPAETFGIAAGDLNNDGLPDLAVVCKASNLVSVMLNKCSIIGPVPCLAPPANMVAWYPLDELSPSTSTDLAGVNNQGAWVNGPTPTPGKVAGGMHFSSGTQQWVQAPTQAELNFGTGDFSIDAWIRTSSAAPGVRTIVDKRTAGSPPFGLPITGYAFSFSAGHLGLQLADGNFTNYFSSSPSVIDGAWHLAAVTVQRGSTTGGHIYLDGALIYTFDPTGRAGSLTNSGPLYLGVAADFLSSPFGGDIDEVELFNRALTPGEVLQVYQADHLGKCKPNSGRICGIKFNDANHNGVLDSGEALLPNWTIQLHTPSGNVVTVQTDPLGEFCFDNLPAGTYTVCELAQAGWIQTAPPGGCVTVTITSNGVAPAIRFGNWACGTPDPCTPGPANMSAWYPLDETSGTIAHEVLNGANGSWVGSPAPIAQYVDHGLFFASATDMVSAPAALATDVGLGNFTADAWVRILDPGVGLRIILDRRSPVNQARGYELFLLDGKFGVQLADARSGIGDTNYICNVCPVNDGSWHHVAVTVDRSNPLGLTLFLDGIARFVFDPTGRPGTLSNNGPFLIGQAGGFSGGAFNGVIDEVEVFKRALTPGEILALYNAGAGGKCKTVCHVPAAIPFCGTGPVNSVLTICNYSASPRSFTWTLAGLPAGSAGCTAPGPSLFNPPSGNTGVLLPGACVNVAFTMTPPAGMSVGKTACYQLAVQNDSTGACCQSEGRITRTQVFCIPNLVNPYYPVPLAAGVPRQLPFDIINPTATPLSIPFSVQVGPFGAPAGSGGKSGLRLNGLPPGVPWTGVVSVGAGASATIYVEAQPGDEDPVELQDIVLSSDVDGDAVLDPIDSRVVQVLERAAMPLAAPPRPLEPTLGNLRASSNPFRSIVTLRFELAEAANVTAAIFDASGRVMRVLQPGRMPAGATSLKWDGRDQRGVRLPAGVYLVRVQAAGRSATIRVVAMP